jgi:hypothetical protein
MEQTQRALTENYPRQAHRRSNAHQEHRDRLQRTRQGQEEDEAEADYGWCDQRHNRKHPHEPIQTWKGPRRRRHVATLRLAL